MHKRTGSYRVKSALVHLWLTIVTLLFVFPIIWVFLTSIKNRADAISIPPTWLFIPTITNYLSILQKADFTRGPAQQHDYRLGGDLDDPRGRHAGRV